MLFRTLKFIPNASIFFGAFLCLGLTACGEKNSTPNWSEQSSNHEASSEQSVNDSKKTLKHSDVRSSVPSNETRVSQGAAAQPKEIRFLSYNLRNYLTMRRYTNGKVHYTSKPETEIQSLIETIKNTKPDILGICEIGRDNDLKDLQNRLKQVGIDLPHSRRAYGADQVRSLAILSRYPILSWSIPKNMRYQLNGRSFKMSRGILDVTIQLPSKNVRFLGVHFKSKRPTKDADQALMRRNESMLLRKHIDQILKEAPETLLMTYGDFNDSKQSKAIYTVKGRSQSDMHVTPLELTDSRGESWTHHWKREGVYSRFDYAMVNTQLAPFIVREKSKIIDDPIWEKASDHRALLVVIK